jgi:hypothetical protein
MLRGSRPGERRGGRKLHTPNRRTVLTDRILAAGLDHPTASRRDFLLELVRDPKVPADVRMEVAPKCFPAKRMRPPRPRALRSSVERGTSTNSVEASKGTQTAAAVPLIQDWDPQALDALLGIVQDAAADLKARRKVALKIAEALLPKAGKKAKVVPDEYGFTVNPNLARKYRDMKRELRSLDRGKERKIPAVAQMIQKLKAQVDAIRQRLEVPCPSKYSRDQAHRDLSRLTELLELRADNTALTDAQDAEEAHLRARFDAFVYNPENIAGLRLKALEDAKRRFNMRHYNGHSFAPPLSPQDERDLEFLRRLYSTPQRPFSEGGQSVYDDREEFRSIHGDHPFWDKLAADGNLYPEDSKLRPRNAA